MLGKISTYGMFGIEAYPIEIEVDVSPGLPAFNLVGLADATIRESKERVKSAIKNSGFSWPDDRITVNLAPSNFKKEGASLDLAIALGILSATGQTKTSAYRENCFLGELSLDGAIRPTQGMLAISLAAAASGVKNLVLAEENAKEAALVSGVNIFPLKTLRETVEFLHHPEEFKVFTVDLEQLLKTHNYYQIDFSEIKGQHLAKRSIEVAVSGGHNLLMIGPPGSGKTMLAKRIPTIMPDLTFEEALEITRIHSATGNLSFKNGILATRPFRSPHHSISDIALVGGGSFPRPGEISLAHQGVLFLDELPEFHRNCLEALRQPLEEGNIRISRISKSHIFPATFLLACAMNPCKCGRYFDLQSSCRCSTQEVYKYRSRISSPLLDRIDIHIEVPAVRYNELSADIPAESSAQIKERVNQARAIQRQRFQKDGIACNARMSHKLVRKFCVLGKEENELLKLAMAELNFSARAYDKILKISRTIADLAGSEQIKTEHLSEAIQYRSLDRSYPA